MSKQLFRYTFPPSVAMPDIEMTVVLAIVATQCIHGEARVRLELRHHLDVQQRKCIVDATTPTGSDFNRLLVGFLTREFGEDGFVVEPVDQDRSSGFQP